MAVKVFSLASLSAFGYSPTGRYNALNPGRVNNPNWNFSRTVVVTFKSSGTWTCPTDVTEVEYLVVAGGGGGAGTLNDRYAGGAGGAGGFRTGTGLSVTPGTTYTVTVGGGGSGGIGIGSGGGGECQCVKGCA